MDMCLCWKDETWLFEFILCCSHWCLDEFTLDFACVSSCGLVRPRCCPGGEVSLDLRSDDRIWKELVDREM